MAGERERGGGHRGGREERDSVSVDKLVHINRVAKVVKGGKRFGFAAVVVIGDQKGRVGFGHGKAREVPEAIRKATEAAKRNLTRVALREGRTLHHDIAGRHGAGRVYLRAAPAGTGIIAGGPMRAVVETLASASSLEKTLRESGKTGANIDAAKAVGKLLAERAVKNGVTEVVFDRGGYLYHGRVKALADAARESGLSF